MSKKDLPPQFDELLQALAQRFGLKTPLALLWNKSDGSPTSDTDRKEAQREIEAKFTELLDLNYDILAVEISEGEAEFKERDVEPLLEQASALLDRALADRSTGQAAGEKYATFLIDAWRSMKLVEIGYREESQRKFEVPADMSKAQLDAQTELSNSLQASIRKRNDLSDFFKRQGNASDAIARRYILALLDREQAMGNGDKVGPFPNPQNPVWGKDQEPREQLIFDLRLALEGIETEIQTRFLDVENSATQAQVDAADRVGAGLQSQNNWDSINRGFLHQRLDLDWVVLMLKEIFGNIDWFLDFGAQIESIKPRYQQSIVEAYARLEKVNSGLQLLYGFSTKDSLPPLTKNKKTVNMESVDAIVAWTRKVTTWLAAFTRNCQNYVLPISVRTVIGETEWSDGIGKGSWAFSLKANDHFPHDARIRLRGIAAWVSGGDSDRLWTVDLQLPNDTHIIDESGSSSHYGQGTIQCRISKVTQRSANRSSEIAGIVSCYNASPVDDWKVSIDDAFGRRDPLGNRFQLDDVQMDLYLSVVPRISKQPKLHSKRK